jgi:hypothetical protein
MTQKSMPKKYVTAITLACVAIGLFVAAIMSKIY